MNSILVTCKYHTHLIPGVFELLNDIERLDILRLMTFPWQFRYIQKLCMEELYIKWCDFILTGINGYLKIPNKISDVFGSFQTYFRKNTKFEFSVTKFRGKCPQHII